MPCDTGPPAERSGSTSGPTARRLASKSRIAVQAFPRNSARKPCAASAGSIRADPRRVPGWASRLPKPSLTSTTASSGSRTMNPACGPLSNCHCGPRRGRRLGPPKPAAGPSANATASASEAAVVRFKCRGLRGRAIRADEGSYAMAHGYLREYDEGWGGDDRDRDDRRERSDRDWRDRSERDDRRERDRPWSDRDRNFMFDRDLDDDRYRDRDEDRGFLSRVGDEAGSWFREDEREGGRDRGAWENNRDWPQRDRGSSYGRERGGFSANPDDHYRSWRDRQMQSLDRDYADYCREREQQFHRDFDQWRSQRHGNPGPLRTGMTQTGLSADPTGMTQAAAEM